MAQGFTRALRKKRFTRTEAEAAIGRYIDSFYNPVRRHLALDFVSPAVSERQAGH